MCLQNLHYIFWCCQLHAWHTGKTILQTMEATSKYRRYRKGVSSPTSTTTTMHGCYACKNVSGSHHPSGEAKPSSIGCCCCFLCHSVISNPTLGHDKSREHFCGMCRPVKKIGTKLFKLGHLDNSNNKNGNLLGRSPSPSMAFPSSISLPSRYNKRAVLCGVSYTKRKFRLKGTINDIANMRELLVKNFKFPNECIRVLTGMTRNSYLTI